MKPLVSILTLTYNHEQYIERCIESVLSQTLQNWEMLIVDDSSQDGTRECIKKYHDNRIVLLEQENVGLWRMQESYRRALSVAKGKLVAILDGDDWWPSSKLEIQHLDFKDDEVAMSFGTADWYDQNGRFFYRHQPPHEVIGNRSGKVLALMILRKLFYPHSATVMVRKGLLDELGGFLQPEYLPLVDIPTWLNILPKGRCVGHRELCGMYRIFPGSAVRTHASTVEEGHMRYALDYLESDRQDLELTESGRSALKRELMNQHHHLRAVRSIQQGDHRLAIFHLKNSIGGGGLIRKSKSAARLMQTLVLLSLERLTGFGSQSK